MSYGWLEETVEWGVWLDDAGSTDIYASRSAAEAAQRRHGGTVVKLTTRIEQASWPCCRKHCGDMTGGHDRPCPECQTGGA